MNPTPSNRRLTRRRLGRIRGATLAALGFVAVVGAVVAWFLIDRPEASLTPTQGTAAQEQIDEELGELQRDFQTAMQEKLDVSRIAGRARAFTERHPDEPAGHVLLAQVRTAMQSWESAYAAWTKALAYDPDAFELCKMAGVTAAKLGRYEQSLIHYQDAVEATDDRADAEVYAALGRLHLALGDPDAAEAMFVRAIDAPGPGDQTNWKHEAHAGLADVASVRGRFDEAIERIDRAIKLARIDSAADLAGYRIQKARIYIDADRDDDAVTMLGYTWSEHPRALWRIESASLRARLYKRAGELDKAADHIQSVTEWHRMADDRDEAVLADFTALLADWQIQANRIDAARISLHNLQTLAPEHPDIAPIQAKLP
ncbi:MAG: tetratricopeptide repeat protein [Phycisphaeraceae bacterium]